MKLNKLILTALMSYLSLSANASVTAKRLGVGGILIEDEKIKLLFDPAFTKPTILNLLALKKFKSDEKLVSSMMAKLSLSKIDAIFVTHTHFDHAVDAPVVADLMKSILYADSNMQRIASAYMNERVLNLLFLNSERRFDSKPIPHA